MLNLRDFHLVVCIWSRFQSFPAFCLWFAHLMWSSQAWITSWQAYPIRWWGYIVWGRATRGTIYFTGPRNPFRAGYIGVCLICMWLDEDRLRSTFMVSDYGIILPKTATSSEIETTAYVLLINLSVNGFRALLQSWSIYGSTQSTLLRILVDCNATSMPLMLWHLANRGNIIWSFVSTIMWVSSR